MAPLARLERAACGLGIRRSIHLSYRGVECKYRTLFFLRQVYFGETGEAGKVGREGSDFSGEIIFDFSDIPGI
jgi:hypothetical protein